jgi:site-specific recombinase XerC
MPFFDQAVKEFLADLELASRAPLTRKRHRIELGMFGRWIEAQRLDWAALTRKQLQAYLRQRAGLSASARGNMYCSLRTFFAWSVEQEYISTSPATGLRTPRRPRPLPRALTVPQVRQLVTHLRAGDRRRDRRDRALLLTGLYAGLRSCELAELCWSDIDLPAKVINITLSKMNKGRSVPIHDELADELRAWREVQAGADSWPGFSLSEQPITSARVGKIARRISQACGVRFSAHTLRHTFATWALRRSGNLYGVSKALGHSQLAQTEVYVSADVEQLRQVIGALPRLELW